MSSRERTACLECDLIVWVGALAEGEKASCPRCGHVITANVPGGASHAIAYALAGLVFLLLSNAFPFLELEAGGLERVMTLPGSAVELYRDGYLSLAILVAGPIVGIPAAMLLTLLALLLPLARELPAPWLVPAGRLLFTLGPWSMVEVFVIGVLVSLVKIAAMAHVVIGLSFLAYVGFAVCFIAALANLDRLQMWQRIEAVTAR